MTSLPAEQLSIDALRFSRADLHHLLDTVAALPSLTDLNTFASHVVETAARLSGADRVMFSVTDNPFGLCVAAFWPDDTDLPSFMPAYEAHFTQNPVGNHYGKTWRTDVVRLSDTTTPTALDRTDFQHLYLKPAHVAAYMTGYMAPTERYRLALTALRERGDFTPLERDRLEFFRGHMVRAFQTAALLARAQGSPLRGEHLLAHPSLPANYVIRTPHTPNEPRMCPPDVPPGRLVRISPRELEVLRWICRGKTNPEIAAILGCSPRTVQKHTEHLFAKLDVPTRSAASIEAVRLGLFTPSQ